MMVQTIQMEVFRIFSKSGSRHHRQANYTALRRIEGCPAQLKISCDSPSAARAGSVASPRQTGLPFPVMIGTPLIVVDWTGRKIVERNKARSRDQKIPRSEGAGWKDRMFAAGLERRRVHIWVEIREMKSG